MKSLLQVSFTGVFLLLTAVTLVSCGSGERLRHIRRITAADLPATSNFTSGEENDVNSEITTNTSSTTKPNNSSLISPKILNITEVSSPSTIRPSVTETIRTSSTTSRRRRPVSETSTESSNTTERVTTTTKRPYIPVTRSPSRSKNLNATDNDSNCTSDSCGEKSDAVANIASSQDEGDESSKKKTSKDKLQELSTVRPTDRTFNNIVSSSTARIVIQENIHSDILRHLTTASYAHYETDYVLDEDADSYEAGSSSKRHSTNPYEPVTSEPNTTPHTALFDEAYARVSEGIRQNLDEIADRSEEYYESSPVHKDSLNNESLAKNDTKVSLEFVNRVRIVANDSESANSRHGDLFIDNGTHVDFERSFVESKVVPETSSTVKYIIDDVYSTTKIIPTKEMEESNSIKESEQSASKVEDQQVQGAEDELVTARTEVQEIPTTDSFSREESTTTVPKESLKVRLRLTSGLNKNITNSNIITEENRTKSEPMTESTTATMRANTHSRGRMFPSERYHTYNINNTVEQTATEESKQVPLDQEDSSGTEVPVNPRSRANSTKRASTTRPTTTSSWNQRQYSVPQEAVSTSPRNTIVRGRTTRRPLNNTRLGSNNEGNDIISNDSYRTTSRGAMKYGLRGVDQSEYPIPPTAAAWSLATMKEPGRRTIRPNISTTTPKYAEDSEASGSFSRMTTIFNVIAPTPGTNTSNKFSFSVQNVVNKESSNSETTFTTELPSIELTTAETITTTNAVKDEIMTTHIPDEMTTISAEDAEHQEIVDDEDLRFDGKTTQSPEDVEATTVPSDSDDDHMIHTTTHIPYETTKNPRAEDLDHDEKEDETELTTLEPTGIHDVDGSQHLGGESHLESGNNPDDGRNPHGEGDGKDIDTGTKLQDAVENEDHHSEGDNKKIEVKPNKVEVLKEQVSINKEVVEDNKEHHVEKETGEDGGHSDHEGGMEMEMKVQQMSVAPSTLANVSIETNEINVTSSNESMIETSSRATTSVQPIQVTDHVHTFMRLFVESSLQEFCYLKEIFKKAVADLLTVGTGRTVTLDKVKLKNIEAEQCLDAETSNTTTDIPGQLLPIEMYIVDQNGMFDQQLNDAFPMLWGHSDLDFSLRIRKVDVVDESLSYSSSGGNGAVIAAITISCIGAICLLILAVLLIVMRKRQKKVNYGMRCTPVSLDAYSLDSVSIHGSVRRKGGVRASKRSYGNPAFEDPGSPSHPMNFATLSNFTSDREALEEEFTLIPHVTPKSDELPEGAETKNRYANVIPLPETRVVLTVLGEEPLSDYINANYVRGPKNSIKCYIACQAPLQSTVTDFWRMVWEQQSKVIMMLTDLVENGVEKCADYLPPSEVLDCHRLFGDYQVTLKKREVREEYVISTLQLKNMESNSWREITHLWYLSWPNQGVPEEPSSVIAFLIEARSYMKNSNGPSIVHCSPGTGRTGTVLACDLCIREFETTRLIDVPRCVARLRKDRAGCVQTRDQYAFIYKVLNLYATKLTGGALDSI